MLSTSFSIHIHGCVTDKCNILSITPPPPGISVDSTGLNVTCPGVTWMHNWKLMTSETSTPRALFLEANMVAAVEANFYGLVSRTVCSGKCVSGCWWKGGLWTMMMRPFKFGLNQHVPPNTWVQDLIVAALVNPLSLSSMFIMAMVTALQLPSLSVVHNYDVCQFRKTSKWL